MDRGMLGLSFFEAFLFACINNVWIIGAPALVVAAEKLQFLNLEMLLLQVWLGDIWAGS